MTGAVFGQIFRMIDQSRKEVTSMIDSTNPRIMADNIRALSANSGGSNVVPNPGGQSTGELESLGIDGSKYRIPTYSPADYSTSEVDTGIKWIDNSPIYRIVKTFDSSDITSEAGGGKVLIGSITPDEIVTFVLSLQKGVVSVPFAEGSDLYVDCFFSIDAGSLYLHLRYGSVVSSDLVAYFVGSKIIVEYTKAVAANSTRKTSKK